MSISRPLFDGDPAQLVGRMADYLAEIRLNVEAPNFDTDFLEGKYDDLFSVAYDSARRSSGEDGTLVNNLRTSRSIGDWDYKVARFPLDDELRRVVPENIKAAGAIDYVYWYGEAMGIFRVVDAIVLAWGAGRLDVTGGESSNRLYRYLKLRDERSSPEERGLLYKRVINRGETKLLKRMVVNRYFPGIWQKLMVECARFISKQEKISTIGSDGDRFARTPISSRGIEQVVIELQHNLTEFTTGLAHMQAREMHEYLEDAFAVLADDQVLDALAGGRRRNPWTVIERVTKEEFGVSINIAALQTIAEKGNEIFLWIADYNEKHRPNDDKLRELLDAAESYIIAQEELANPQDPELEENDEEPVDVGFNGKYRNSQHANVRNGDSNDWDE